MTDEIKRISEMDPNGVAYKAELRKIREAKTREVAHTIRGLLAIEAARNLYDGTGDFLDSWQENVPLVKPSEMGTYLFGSHPEVFDAVLSLMLSTEYNPPSNLKEVLMHLIALWGYYITSYDSRITLVDVLIDFSFIKIKGVAENIFTILAEKGERELKRVKKSIKIKKAKMQEKELLIYECFYRLDIKGMSFNKIAKTIEKILIEQGQYPKSLNGGSQKDYSKSIKRYLLRNETIRSDLTNMGILKGQM